MGFKLNRKLFENAKGDSSLAMLVMTNLITLFFALWQNWSMFGIIFIYWGQSVIIGIVNFFRILLLKNYSVKGLKRNGKQVKKGAKVSVAFFFAFHYGFFHFIYFVFILFFATYLKQPLVNNGTLLILLLFLVNHFYSFIKNRREDEKRRRNLGTLLFYPYIRILPMHLTLLLTLPLVAVFSGKAILVLFVALKTVADALMHIIEHNGDEKIE